MVTQPHAVPELFLAARAIGALGELASSIDSWTEELLSEYLSLFPRNPHRSGKSIHDCVWGMVWLEPHELYILDSPLLQRLRYIRQLGVAHFLFPTTAYSRFEHTLGTVQVIELIWDSLKRDSFGFGSIPPAQREEHRVILRMSALLHDVGHCVFSHVSEKFYRHHPLLRAARDDAERCLGVKISPSELLAVIISTSPAVLAMLKQARFPITRWSEEQIAEWLVACVTGAAERMSPHLFLADLVNGPVDCDKLDYLMRDSRMAGTPIMLDPMRLISKLKVARLEPRMDRFTLAIDLSGVRTYEEMLATRVFLYDKLYYHQKVVAAEELLRQAFGALASAGVDIANPGLLLRFTDEGILSARPEDFAQLSNAGDSAGNALAQGCSLLRRVRDRMLPRRSYAFAPRFQEKAPEYIAALSGDAPDSDVGRDKYAATKLFMGLSNDAFRAALGERIQHLAGELAGHGVGRVYVGWSDSGRVAGGTMIPATDADGRIQPFDFLFAADRWAEAYAANKLTGYVYADEPSGEVFIAAERVFAERGLRLGEQSRTVAKVELKEVARVRASLTGDWLPHRLPTTFLSDGGEQSISEVVRKLSPYLESAGFDPGKMVRAWLWQFPDPDLQESALRLLTHFRIFRRHELDALLARFLEKYPIESQSAWCPLAPQRREAKSADRMAYDLNHGAGKNLKVARFTTWGLEDLRGRGRITFFDDCLCTGTQVRSLLLSWFGREAEADSPSDVDPPLPAEYQRVLTELPVRFFVSTGFLAGRDVLLQTCRELGINAEVHLGIDAEAQGMTLSSVKFHSEESGRRLYAHLYACGTEVMRTRAREKPHLAPQIEAFALGYGGLQANFCFEYMVPTCVTTALWGFVPDTDDGDRWLPLIPRDPEPVKQSLRKPDTILWSTLGGNTA